MKISSQKIILIIAAIFLSLFNFLTQNCLSQIVSMYIYLIILLIIKKNDFFHPLIWYSCGIVVYSTAYPILYLLNVSTSRGYSNEPLFMTSIFLIIITIVLPLSSKNDFNINKKNYVSNFGSETLINIISIFLLCCIGFISMGNFHNKNDIYNSSNLIIKSAFFIVYIYIILYSFILSNKLSNYSKFDKKLFIKVGTVVLLLTLFSGERDIFLRFVLMNIFILFYYKKIEKKQMLILLIMGLLCIPITAVFKYYFLSGNIVQKEISTFKDIISLVLRGEFESASRNLQFLVNHKGYVKGIMGGKTYISDITRIFGYAKYSAINWYQNTFFFNNPTGQGFTIIGEGYINFGYFGIVFEAVIVSIILRIIYINSTKNIFNLIIYINCIPIYIYSIRADLANILTPLFRQVIFSIFIIILADRFIKKVSNNYNEES